MDLFSTVAHVDLFSYLTLVVPHFLSPSLEVKSVGSNG